MASTSAIFDIGEKGYGLYEGKSLAETSAEHMIKSMKIELNDLNRAFFSEKNVTNIQLGLRKRIFEKMGYKIDRQSDDQLLIIMRTIYFQHSTNDTRDVKKEVARLNTIVVESAAPIIAAGLQQYLSYLRDASTMPVPIDRSKNTSVKGSKTIEMNRQIL